MVHFFSYIFLFLICLNEREESMEILKVSSKSNPNSVAGAIANVFRENGMVEVQAVGAGALNQAIKAIAVARGFVAPTGVNLVCIPAFQDIVIESEERTAIKLIVVAK
jgi:stage V sporulation protein S